MNNKIYNIRKCEKGHYSKIEEFWFKNGSTELYPDNVNFCVVDGTKVLVVQLSSDSEEFKKVYKEKPKDNFRVIVDTYEISCDFNHKEIVGGYGNYSKYIYCGICGSPITKVKDVTEIVGEKNDML